MYNGDEKLISDGRVSAVHDAQLLAMVSLEYPVRNDKRNICRFHCEMLA